MRAFRLGFLAFVLSLLAGLTMAAPASAGPGPFYWIVAQHSGKALMPLNDVKDYGAEIVQLTMQGNRGAQNWSVEREGTGSPTVNRKFNNRHSHLCVESWDHVQGSVLRQGFCHNDGLWPIWQVSNVDDMWSGRPFTVWNRQTLMCMSVWGGLVDDFTRVVQWPCHGGSNQTFRLVHVPGT